MQDSCFGVEKSNFFLGFLLVLVCIILILLMLFERCVYHIFPIQFSCYAAIKVMRIKQKTGTKEKPRRTEKKLDLFDNSVVEQVYY